MNYLSRSKVFLYLMTAFVVGVFLGKWIGDWMLILSLAVKLLICYAAILFLFLPGFPRPLRLFIAILIIIFLGIWRYQSSLPIVNESHVTSYNDNGEVYLIEGVVGLEPADKGSNLQLQVSDIVMDGRKISGDILLTIPKYYETNYGDRVTFSTKLATPQSYEAFDYQDYLARFGVYSIAKSVDDFEITNRSCRGAIYCTQEALLGVKNYFSRAIQRIYPEPHASFMLGLLVGAKKGLPEWLLNIFQIVGITHIIAISGYNITILAKVAEKTLGRIGRKYIFWGVLAMIVSFVIMTGAQASIVRAGIMGGLLVYAGYIGRRSNVINVLVFAGMVMIFLNPLILRSDVGFQLSFLATLGLVYASPIFEHWFQKVPEFFCTIISATLAAQVLTLPIIISSFGRMSLIAPIANVIVLGFIPIAMFLGFISGGLGMIWLPLGQVVGFLGYMVLEIIIRISEVLSRIPYASVEVNMNSWVFWAVYYVLVGLFIRRWYRLHKKDKN